MQAHLRDPKGVQCSLDCLWVGDFDDSANDSISFCEFVTLIPKLQVHRLVFGMIEDQDSSTRRQKELLRAIRRNCVLLELERDSDNRTAII